MRPFILFLVLLCPLTAGWGMATAKIDQDVWAPLQFLFGEWEGADNSGAGSGHFSFTPDLQRKVVVRHNHAQYPPANGRPAYVHDDLMIVYFEGDPTSLKAIYFDTEGHVIRYVGQITATAQVTFVSEIMPNAPRYRLTYAKLTDGGLSGKFEIAPPGKPEAFAKYLEWLARAKGKRP